MKRNYHVIITDIIKKLFFIAPVHILWHLQDTIAEGHVQLWNRKLHFTLFFQKIKFATTALFLPWN